MKQQQQDHRFYSHHGRAASLHLEVNPKNDDDYRMLKFYASKRENGQQVHFALHFMSYEDARYLAYLIKTHQVGETYKCYKGYLKDGKATARVLRIIAKDDGDFLLSVAEGPGLEGNNGIITPKPKAPKEAWRVVTLLFKPKDLIKMALEIEAILNAIAVAEVLGL